MSLFSHHAAKPEEIRRHAESAAGKATAFHVLAGTLSQRSSAVAGEVDGYIEPVHTVTAALENSSGDMSKASYLGAGCMNQYASAVETYNTAIDRLNERYDTAKAADFYVGIAICTTDGEIHDGEEPADRDAAISREGAELRTTLRQERTVLLGALDSEAESIATQLRGGPDNDTITLLIAAGHLPMSALEVFPGIDVNTLNTIRSYFHEARKLWKTPGKIRKLYAMFSVAGDLKSVAAELARVEGQWAQVLGAIGRNLDTTSLASLNTYMQSRQEISLLQYTKLFTEADFNLARTSWIDAAKASGKVGGPLAFLSVIANGADLVDLIKNGNDGKSGWDTALRATGDVTGLISSGGGLLALTPVLSLGPVGAGVLIAAGLVSCGIMIYRNWDDISGAVSTAWNWSGDRLTEGWNATTDWVSETWDDAGEELEDIGNSISDGWDAITPW